MRPANRPHGQDPPALLWLAPDPAAECAAMQDDRLFQWHPRARLFAGPDPLPRPSADPGHPTAAQIPPAPLQQACTALGHALIDRQPFHIGSRAAETPPPPGTFYTQTGGSTGAPVILRRTQASWIASFALHADRFAYRPEDSIATLGALDHSLSLFGLLEALHLGLDAHQLSGLRPDRQAARLAETRATILYATPTQLRLLCATGTALPDLRLILAGGGALDRPTRDRLASLCPQAALHVFYGAAETSFITLSDADTPEGSVGRAYPGVELRLDEGGLIWVRSPYLCEGHADPTRPLRRDTEGFVTVGEVGRLDSMGNLFLRGRAGRMVTVADQNVFLDEIEATLAADPAMPLCALLAVPDPLRGTALILCAEGPEDPATRDHLTARCRNLLPARARPREVVMCDPFPLLPSGKPDLTTLARRLGVTA